MTDRNTTAVRLWFFALVLGFVYWLGSLARSGVAVHMFADVPKPWVVGLKGASVLTLALSVLAARNGRASQLISLALALSAVADMMLVTTGLVGGGAVFVAAHAIAICAYLSVRDHACGTARKLAALAVPAGAVVCSALALAGSGKPLVLALFPIASGAMAASAILSRFPLALSGLGAAIFVASDVLFFVDIGPLHGSGQLGFLTWATYFIGFAMVARGAARSIRGSDER